MVRALNNENGQWTRLVGADKVSTDRLNVASLVE